MFEPTTNEYGRPVWTPSDPFVRTADGVVIQHGMAVWTNDLEVGTVDLGVDGGREATYEWHGPEKRWVLWFDVLVVKNNKGEVLDPALLGRRVMQSDDRVATRFNGRSASVEIAVVETVAVDDPGALAYDEVQAKEEARVLRAALAKERKRTSSLQAALADALRKKGV